MYLENYNIYSFKVSFKFIFICVLCVCASRHTQVCHGMGVRGQLCEVDFLSSSGLGDQTQVI